jgi:hypothetical protein
MCQDGCSMFLYKDCYKLKCKFTEDQSCPESHELFVHFAKSVFKDSPH